jgi:cyclophilin family peptidyl-prolyl cis-trans isomerase
MHSFKGTRALIAGAALLAGLALQPAQAAQAVKVTTNMGEFVIELNEERAPLTVANFLRYVKEGFYSGTVFHRVVGNFVVQGGGHAAVDYKLKTVHESVVNESGNGLQNKRGTVGLARAAGPHSGNSQFYVNIGDNPDLDPLPARWGYTVFGRVISGMDVVDRMGVVPTGSVGPLKSEAPLKPIVIEKVELTRATAAAPESVNRATMPSSEASPPPQ